MWQKKSSYIYIIPWACHNFIFLRFCFGLTKRLDVDFFLCCGGCMNAWDNHNKPFHQWITIKIWVNAVIFSTDIHFIRPSLWCVPNNRTFFSALLLFRKLFNSCNRFFPLVVLLIFDAFSLGCLFDGFMPWLCRTISLKLLNDNKTKWIIEIREALSLI